MICTFVPCCWVSLSVIVLASRSRRPTTHQTSSITSATALRKGNNTLTFRFSPVEASPREEKLRALIVYRFLLHLLASRARRLVCCRDHSRRSPLDLCFVCSSRRPTSSNEIARQHHRVEGHDAHPLRHSIAISTDTVI